MPPTSSIIRALEKYPVGHSLDGLPVPFRGEPAGQAILMTLEDYRTDVMNTAEIRDAYLSFFADRAHKKVPSSTLVPHNDPTLLFTNAGMVQFKDALLGREDPGYRRATSSQRCVRAGGKHNDLENVGYTARHHTFFEMLGNFSFGDYFKDETIAWAWQFTTEVLKFAADRIWVTVHPSDTESRRIWIEDIGIPAERVIDLEENFWAMGDTGPCGPCTELFYDHGPDVAGGPPGSPDEDGDRYIEFWNLVFPQFDRSADGELTPLPQAGVDTGMGLERVAAIKQGVHSNYEIDLFRHLIGAAGSLAGINDLDEGLANASLRVIADHIRSSAFLIADGVMPGNEDRSYVLRRIIRRALRHGYKLDIREPFFHRLVAPLVEQMGEAYPLLAERQAQVESALKREEERFAETLNQGMDLLGATIAELDGTEIPGDVAFRLYDTYGFPVDLTADVARERGLSVDMQGFSAAMEAQRERGRAGARFSANLGQTVQVQGQGQVVFTGYEQLADHGKVVALFDANGSTIERLDTGDRGIVVLDRTPFYAEAGGQVGDAGQLLGSAGETFLVEDTLPGAEQYLHIGQLSAGSLTVGVELSAQVDQDRRRRIMAHHSATHLLHAALRKVLGDHVEQKGSLVDADRLRFDFSHAAPLTANELSTIESLVNDHVQLNHEVVTEQMGRDQAMKKGAMALFGEKYGDSVRVLTMGADYSVELCGGTHVGRTGDIGYVRLTGESGIAAGVRRVEAVAGVVARAYVNEREALLLNVSDQVKATPADTPERVRSLIAENRRLGRELASLKQSNAQEQGADMAAQAQDVGGVMVIARVVDGDAKTMMSTLDQLRSRLDQSVVVLGQVNGGKVSLVAGVSKDLTDRIDAPSLIALIGDQVGAKGGGRPDLARAGGGTHPDRLEGALAGVSSWVAERV